MCYVPCFIRIIAQDKFMCLFIKKMKDHGPPLNYRLFRSTSPVVGFGTRSKDEIAFFRMEGCSHCDNALPAYLEAGKRSNIPMILYDNTTEMGRKKIRDEDVTSFPTIIGYRGDRKMYYSGNRSTESFLQFSSVIGSDA